MKSLLRTRLWRIAPRDAELIRERLEKVEFPCGIFQAASQQDVESTLPQACARQGNRTISLNDPTRSHS